MNFGKITNKIERFHSQSKTVDAAYWLLKKFKIETDNVATIKLREKATPENIIFTTEGKFGEPQVINIPENTFQFPLPLLISLLLHEMVHVRQKTIKPYVLDKNEREWQAYFDMNFHTIHSQVIELTDFYKLSFANKALEYYNRMGENSELQQKYYDQKCQVEALISALKTD